MSICRVYGKLKNPSGENLVNTLITFDGGKTVAKYGNTVIPRYVSATSDSAGDFEISLYPGQYKGFVYLDYGKEVFDVFIPDVESIDFDQCIEQYPPLTPSVLQQTEAARDQARAWAEGTMPGGVGTKSAREWAVEVAAISVLERINFASRAEAVAASTALDWQIGAIICAGTVQYRYTGTGVVIADMPGWVPFGTPTPWHWGAVGDFSVDDTVPCKSWASYGGILDGGGGSYLISARMKPVTNSLFVGRANFRASGEANFSAFDIREVDGQVNVSFDCDYYIDGRKSFRSASDGQGILIIGPGAASISGVRSENWPNAGGLLQGPSEATVKNCKFIGNGGVGLSNSGVMNLYVSDTEMLDNGLENFTFDGDSNNADIAGCRFGQHKGGCGNIGIDSDGRIRFVGGLIDSGNTTAPSSGNRNGICVNSKSSRTPDVSVSGMQIQGCVDSGVIIRDRSGSGGFVGGDLTINGVTFRANGTDLSIQETTGAVLVDSATRLNSVNITDTSSGDVRMASGVSAFRRNLSANQTITANGAFVVMSFTEQLQNRLTSQSGNAVQLPFGGLWHVTAKLRFTGLTAGGATDISIRVNIGDQSIIANEKVVGNVQEVTVSGVLFSNKALASVDARVFGSGGVVTVEDDNVTTFFHGHNVC